MRNVSGSDVLPSDGRYPHEQFQGFLVAHCKPEKKTVADSLKSEALERTVEILPS
jgi:hypothetical protein